jgi:Kinesin motor domain
MNPRKKFRRARKVSVGFDASPRVARRGHSLIVRLPDRLSTYDSHRQYYQQAMSSSFKNEGIHVAIRMRPMNERELRDGQEQIFRCAQNTVVQCSTKDGQAVEGQVHHYDQVFDESTQTKDIYDSVATSIIKGAVRGINGTLFACKKRSTYIHHSHKLMAHITESTSLFTLLVLLLMCCVCYLLDIHRRPDVVRQNPHHAWWRRPRRRPRYGSRRDHQSNRRHS